MCKSTNIAAMWKRDWRKFRSGKRRSYQWIHPDDREHVRTHFKKHKKCLNTFPSPFFGPIDTAKVIIAYASPGNSPADKKLAKDPDWIRRRVRSFNGRSKCDLNLFRDHEKAKRWFEQRVDKILGFNISEVSKQIAFVNLSAYRGDSSVWREAACAPTTQAMRYWLRERICEKRGPVVLIMRAANEWGFGKAPFQKGKKLFVLDTTRSGLPKSGEQSKRARAVNRSALAAARKAVA